MMVKLKSNLFVGPVNMSSNFWHFICIIKLCHHSFRYDLLESTTKVLTVKTTIKNVSIHIIKIQATLRIDNSYLVVLAFVFNEMPRYYLYSHYSVVIMGAMASQITSLTIVYLILNSGADQRKHQSSASLVFVTGEFPAQMASNAENVSIWLRHHVLTDWDVAWPESGPVVFFTDIQCWLASWGPFH